MNHWDSTCADTWSKYDLSAVAEWAREGSPTHADVFGQVHQNTLPPLTSLTPFKLWHTNADMFPCEVARGEQLGLFMAVIDIGAQPLPDRMRAENGETLSAAADRFGDVATVDPSQHNGADGWWTVARSNRVQFPEWCRPRVPLPVEIGTCRPGQLADRISQHGACVRWPYGSTVAVIISTNSVEWKGKKLAKWITSSASV